MGKAKDDKMQQDLIIDSLKTVLEQNFSNISKEEVQKLVMEVLETTINDWESSITTEEGMQRLAERFGNKDKERK